MVTVGVEYGQRSGGDMTSPTFKPGDEVWHVRHGKVTIEAPEYHRGAQLLVVTHDGRALNPRGDRGTLVRPDGKDYETDVGRVLYTLAEAEQYGWYKPEPLREVPQETRPKRAGGMNILDNLSAIDQGAHELWSDLEVRQAMRALPALIRVARAAAALEGADLDPSYGPDVELIKALQQLREAGGAE